MTKRAAANLGIFLVTLASVTALLIPSLKRDARTVRGEDYSLKSPALATLARELQAGRRDSLDAFWKRVEHNAPLVEPVAGEPRQCWVTFLWRGDHRTKAVGLAGGPPREGRTGLVRLLDTNLWYRTERLADDARLGYWFHVNVPEERPTDPAAFEKMMEQCPSLPDPMNPLRYENRSLLELSNAPPQPWIKPLPGLPQGKLSTHTIRSRTLNQDRAFTLYTPPGYDPMGKAYGLLINFDGPGLTEDPATLDNLIGAGKVAPIFAVFINHIDRSAELGCSDDFTKFLADELVAWTREQFNMTKNPKRTIVRGLSLGGLAASYCALQRPDVFGNVLSQSGSYQWFPEGAKSISAPPSPDAEPGWLTQRIVSEPKCDVTFYLEAGRFEHFHPYSLLAENRRFRDVLRAKGYTVHYSEFTGGHDPVNWRGSFADGLMRLAPK